MAMRIKFLDSVIRSRPYTRIIGVLTGHGSKRENIKTPFFTKDDPRYNKFTIGDWTYGKPKVLFAQSGAKLIVGKFCSFADDVTIFLGGEHRVDWVTTYPFNVVFNEKVDIKGHPHTKGDVLIGNDVWLGYGATILSGVRIGNGAVVGTKSVVTKDVPAYAIVAGNPAKIIRYRFSPEQIHALEQISWWDWEIDRVLSEYRKLLQDNPDQFIEFAKTLHARIDVTSTVTPEDFSGKTAVASSSEG